MIPKGSRNVTCRECGANGTLVVQDQRNERTVRVLDYVQHKESCSQFRRPQPSHLRTRTSVRSQERRANSLVGARETIASGALGKDGDGRSFNRWRVESKQTKYGFYSLSKQVWTKLVSGAERVGEEPLLHVELRDQFPYRRICVVKKSLYEAWSGEVLADPQNQIVDRFQLPKVLSVEPLAVAIEEDVFKRMKEKHDV